MESIDLSRLTASTFERLVRALAFELMGPAGVVYSSGPDGARDFTFEGEIKGYESQGWNGYVVLQAKFKETLSETEKDAVWLDKQLTNELKKFKDRHAKLRCPDYYIVASNVSLSGSDGAAGKGKMRIGGHTKIVNSLKQWEKGIGLRGADIWPASKIIDLLCAFPEVRQTYAAWVTSGDVLTQVLSSLRPKNTQFPHVISRGLKDSIRRDQHARLRDAGSVVDDPVRVSQVFIDLPITLDGFAHRGESGKDVSATSVNSNFVALLAERAKERLDQETLESRRSETEYSYATRNKIVVMGGPGQGKSTASMFLAQLFRAVLLREDSKAKLDANVNKLIPEILERAVHENIPIDLIPRYPVWVPLPRFADAISLAKQANEKIPSLLSYIAGELSSSSDSNVGRDDLRLWLSKYPWIVIFDGLDEVPSSGERAAVVEAIASFQTEIIEQNADVLTVVTTRPQGYNNDLDKQSWEHWNLLELPSERAIAYAEALGNTRYPLDGYRRNDILNSVRKATSRPATSRLMISPLQVTIMYLIVDTGGSVPAARWNLFNEYFEILRKRERAKGGANQKVLEQNWSHLGPIHQRAGLVLQTDSEHVGGALSYLDAPRFKLMLREFLTTEGFGKEDILDRTDQLISLALQRLVLLCSREEGKIAFDVRSLQEFMAASSLTSGNEQDVENRLSHIAGLSHWRHTFLIAASRCFADDKYYHLRSRIVALPRNLDSDFVRLLAQLGPLLSLEMFVDGIGADHPNSRKLLAQHALELLSGSIDDYDERLSLVADEHTEELVLQLLTKEILSKSATGRFFLSWKLLLDLSKRSPSIFLPVAEKYFPTDSKIVCKILNNLGYLLPSDLLVLKSLDAIFNGRPSDFFIGCGKFIEILRLLDESKDFGLHSSFLSLDFGGDLEDELLSIKLLPEIGRDTCRLTVMPFDGWSNLKIDHDDVSGAWKALKSVAIFCANPSPTTLANFLVVVQETGEIEEIRKLQWHLPWPLANIIKNCDSSSALSACMVNALAGEYGDAGTWDSAEQRWERAGVTRDDIEFYGAGNIIGKNISSIGAPHFTRYSISHNHEPAAKIVNELILIIRNFSDPSASIEVSKILQFAALGTGNYNNVVDFENSKFFLQFVKKFNIELSVHFLALLSHKIWDDNDCICLIADSCLKLTNYSEPQIPIDVSLVVGAYNRRTEHRELLCLIAILIGNKNLSSEELVGLDRSAFTPSFDDSNRVLECVYLLSEIMDVPYDRDAAVRAFSAATCFTDTKFVLLYAKREGFWRDQRIYILSTMISCFAESIPVASHKLRILLRKELGSVRSTLRSMETWVTELRLPEDAFLGLRK